MGWWDNQTPSWDNYYSPEQVNKRREEETKKRRQQEDAKRRRKEAEKRKAAHKAQDEKEYQESLEHEKKALEELGAGNSFGEDEKQPWELGADGCQKSQASQVIPALKRGGGLDGCKYRPGKFSGTLTGPQCGPQFGPQGVTKENLKETVERKSEAAASGDKAKAPGRVSGPPGTRSLGSISKLTRPF